MRSFDELCSEQKHLVRQAVHLVRKVERETGAAYPFIEAAVAFFLVGSVRADEVQEFLSLVREQRTADIVAEVETYLQGGEPCAQ